jgi:CheY-like chemotaxis protein
MNTKTILIADDDQDLLYQMNLYVKSFGYQTITASSQKEAEQKLNEGQADFCIFDLMMEQKDSGFVLAHKAKTQKDVPVIIVSNVTAETGMYFNRNDEMDNTWMAADMFMEKNIRKDQLERAIHKLLKAKS